MIEPPNGLAAAAGSYLNDKWRLVTDANHEHAIWCRARCRLRFADRGVHLLLKETEVQPKIYNENNNSNRNSNQNIDYLKGYSIYGLIIGEK